MLTNESVFLSVYLIDDSEVETLFIKKTLDETDLFSTITVFKDPETAYENMVDLIKSNMPFPDLILLDLEMPIMDGFEWIDLLDEELDDTTSSPIVFILTNSIYKKDLEGFEKQYMAKEFIRKPITRADLIEKMKRHFPQAFTN